MGAIVYTARPSTIERRFRSVCAPPGRYAMPIEEVEQGLVTVGRKPSHGPALNLHLVRASFRLPSETVFGFSIERQRVHNEDLLGSIRIMIAEKHLKLRG